MGPAFPENVSTSTRMKYRCSTDIDGVEHLVEQLVQCVRNELTFNVFVVDNVVYGSYQLVDQHHSKLIGIVAFYYHRPCNIHTFTKIIISEYIDP